MNTYENVEIFEDTKRLCEKNEKLKASVAESVKNQKLILESEKLPVVDKKHFSDEAKVVVSTKRTFEAASGYAGQKVAVHSFASPYKPGGGVLRGAGAQEECLCRCSGLYFCLSVPELEKGFYSPHRKAKNPMGNIKVCRKRRFIYEGKEIFIKRRRNR